MKNKQLKVLIVDDDSSFQETLKRRLESRNCIVQCSSNQKNALALLVNEIFHVVFIDCILSEGQGTELAHEMKKIVGDSVEIIMMSGIVPGKSLSNYVNVGFCDFLSKPISEKELEENLSRIHEKCFYGGNKNILDKLFSENKSQIQILKLLISIKEINGHEFFLYLNSALLSGESLVIQAQFNNKKHEITCDRGVIINYENEDPKVFLNRLVSQNLISTEEKEQFQKLKPEEYTQVLLNNCVLSSQQILNVKYDLLTEALKEIVPGMKIKMNVNMINSKPKTRFTLINQSKYADLIFLFLKQRFNNQLFSLFESDIMKKHLIFDEKLPNYLPEVDHFLSDLKEGMKLNGIYKKYIDDKDTFCSYILYILIKGNVYLSKMSVNAEFRHLYERYENLYKFITSSKRPETLFQKLNAMPPSANINSAEMKFSYLRFVKNNHPDSISSDIPESLSNLITKILTKVKVNYDVITDPTLRNQEEKKRKRKKMEKDMFFAENKKICERYLEKSNYKQAFSLIETISTKEMEKDINWQMMYLWISYKASHLTDKNLAHQYMKNVQTQSRDLQKNKIYYYILGLYYESKEEYEPAKFKFLQAKSADPSFQPCYQSIRNCSIKILEQKNMKKSILSKLKLLTGKKAKNQPKKLKKIKKTG